jgi:protocatechuate 3,4-dioxygenase beta subunit
LVLTALLAAPFLAATAATETKLAVEGRVLGPDRSPFRDAQVALVPLPPVHQLGRLRFEGKANAEPLAATRTDERGSFRLTAEPGVYRLIVSARGFVPKVAELAPLTAEVELAPVDMEPDVGLTVRVTGADGKPVAGARVRAEAVLVANPLRGLSALRPDYAFATTDDKGEAVLPRASGAALDLTVQASGSRILEKKGARASTVSLRLAAAQPQQVRVVEAGKKPVPDVLVSAVELRWALAFTGADGTATLPVGAEPLRVRLQTRDGRSLDTWIKPPEPKKPEPQVVLLPAARPVLGRVVSVASGRPVPGAFVWSMSDPGAAIRTSSGGEYRLPGLQENDWIGAGAVGYFSTEFRTSPQLGVDGRGPAFSLTPKLSAEGLVVDERDRPVSDVEVQAALTLGSRMQRSFDLMPSGGLARSNAAGRFRLRDLAAGSAYELSLKKDGYAPARLEIPPLEPDRPAEIRVVLKAGRLCFGRVLDGSNRPVAGARVKLEPAQAKDPRIAIARRLRQGGDDSAESVSGASGRFELRDLPAGSYDLAVKARGFASLTVPGLIVPEGQGATDLGTVALAPGIGVAGVVVDSRGQPIAGAEVRAATPQSPSSFIFRSVETTPADAVSAADGSFVLEDRSTGEILDIAVTHPDYGPGSAPGVSVPASQPIRITLPATRRVEGRVVTPDGQPLSGATVLASEMILRSLGGSQMMGSNRFHRAVTTDEGTFSISGVAPGPIQLRVSLAGYQNAEREGLEVKPGEDLFVELTLEPGATVEGRVLNAAGDPVVRATVRAQEGGMGGAAFVMMSGMGNSTDADGRYLLEGVKPGQRTLVAQAEGMPRAVRDIEVKPGRNTLDFTLAGGHEVTGRVTDESGTGIAGAMVFLREGMRFDAPRTLSGADGSFTLTAVPDGKYRATANKEGYAPLREGPEVVVAGAPVAGVAIQLAAGGAITGRLIGLEFHELSRVRVSTRWGMNTGQVDPEGVYRIANLAPGDWDVSATVPGTDRQASGRVKLDLGVPEVTLDLKFGEGLRLEGRVIRNGKPLAGTSLVLESEPRSSIPRFSETDLQGVFRFGGLEAGTYTLSVKGSLGGLLDRRTLEVSEDLEVDIELATASVSGRVVDAVSDDPVADAKVSLLAPDGRSTDGLDATTGRDGSFTLLEVGEGAWKVQANKEGYGPGETPIEVSGSAPVAGVEVAVKPTQGIVLVITSATGRPPAMVRIAALDGQGKIVASGMQGVGEGGKARIPTIPPGRWELLVETFESAQASLNVVVPGPEVAVALPPGGALTITVPALEESGLGGKATLIGPDGRPYRSLGFDGMLTSEWPLTHGKTGVPRIAVGLWHIAVQGADGRTYTGQAEVTPDGRAEVILK